MTTDQMPPVDREMQITAATVMDNCTILEATIKQLRADIHKLDADEDALTRNYHAAKEIIVARRAAKQKSLAMHLEALGAFSNAKSVVTLDHGEGPHDTLPSYVPVEAPIEPVELHPETKAMLDEQIAKIDEALKGSQSTYEG